MSNAQLKCLIQNLSSRLDALENNTTNVTVNGAALPAPRVRVRVGERVESSADGAPWNVSGLLQVAAHDMPSGLLDPKIEMLRRRNPQYSKGGDKARGWRWTHPANWTGQIDDHSGSSTRGGEQHDTVGTPMVARTTEWPADPEVWHDVFVGPWWKHGTINLFDGANTHIGQVLSPVQTGTKGGDRTTVGGPWRPQWTSNGGKIRQMLAFRLSVQDPLDSRQRISGPVSIGKIEIRPCFSVTVPTFNVWPDGAGGATGVDSDTLRVEIEDIRR